MGPNGRCRSSTKTWPTITGLMNSGTIRIDMIRPRPRKLFIITSATASPSRNSMGDAEGSSRITVSHQRAARDRIEHHQLEVLEADEGMAAELEVVIDEGHDRARRDG